MALDHGEDSSWIFFDTLNGRLHDSMLISKIFLKNVHGNIWGKVLKVDKNIQLEPSPWSSMSYILSMWFVVLTCPGQPECRGLIRPSPWLITSSAYLIHFISIRILELNMCPTISHQTPVRWNTWAVCQRCWSRYDTYKYFLLVPI